jgi:uncharacterized protein
LRVLLDTNVLLSGAFVPGLCLRIIESLVSSREWQIILSEQLLAEFRRHSKNKFKAADKDIEAFLTPLLEWGSMVTPAPVAADACRDADDLPILGAAIAGKAEVLVSGDKDLLTLGSFAGFLILSPREFHNRFLGGKN